MAVVLLEEVSAIDPGVAQEIGTLRVRNDAMITRIGSATGSGGELVFLEDVPATFGTIRKTVRYRRQTGDDVVGGLAQWLRAEAQVVKPNASIQPGMQLVLASARRAGWATCAPFKSPDKKGEWERDNPLASPAAGLEEVIERLEGLSYDYWEKSDFLTAGVSTPAEPAFEDASNVSRTVWVLGACDDSLACQAALYASDRVRQLLA
ncbi:MAG: hypothetical protein NT069_26675, partial [Planctomycetota bacterium]|nr:hypothetical protein [Planctomycetota bacterium]